MFDSTFENSYKSLEHLRNFIKSIKIMGDPERGIRKGGSGKKGYV